MRTATSAYLMDVTTSYWQTKWEWFVLCPVKFPDGRVI
jgi:hypothetical protein